LQRTQKNRHVTTQLIGSLILGKPGHAIYFEKFANKLKYNIKTNRHVCVLAVNSSKWFWFKSLFKGSFAEPPAIRLIGEAGELRKATENEIRIWQKRVKSVSFTKGYNIMWKNMKTVREIHFSKIEPVNIGSMTQSNVK